MSNRWGQFFALVAAGGSGKSTLISQAIKKQVETGSKKIIIVAMAANEPLYFDYALYNFENEKDREKIWNSKEPVLVLKDSKNQIFDWLYKKLQHNSKGLTLILDDANMYLNDSKKIPDSAFTLFGLKRNLGLDIWTTWHSFNQLHPDLFAYITVYGIGVTNDDASKKMSLPPEILARKNEVDRYVMQFGKNSDTNNWNRVHYMRFFDEKGTPIGK